MAQLFLVIETIFRVTGLWGQFTTYVQNVEIAELREKNEALSVALNVAQQAQTQQEIFNAQTTISGLVE